jgi:glycosyltransferase involved in cell wall biosynthesis
MTSLNIGGAERSLVTILNMFDYEKYDVDLFLFKVEGEFLELLPKQVNVLKQDDDFYIFEKQKEKSILLFLKQGKFKKAFYVLLHCFKKIYFKLRYKNKYISNWNIVKHIIGKLPKEYDTSISFIERNSMCFNIDNVRSKNKIGFIHNDYSKYQFDYKQDKKYFKEYDKIATVSEHCKDVLQEIFPEYKEKFLVIKNMVSKELIQKLANETITDMNNDNSIKIVTVGRLVKQKGIDIAIDVCKMLVDNNVDVKWYVIGSGQEEAKLKEKILDLKLEKNFILVGSKKNPYPWIKNCDIYVQPSRFEGYGITVAEAKTLYKPIIATDIPEFREQIQDGKNGILVKDKNEMFEKISFIINNRRLKYQICEGLKIENIENNNELIKLYQIIK